MSYSILYRSMFVKLSDGRFIPMMEMGDNNVRDCNYGRGRGRRSRSWSNMNLNRGQKFFTEDEIKNNLKEWNESCEKQRERYRNSDDVWEREHSEINFGFFQGIAVYGKGGTWGTSFNDVKNIVLGGIKNAISVEEAVKNCGLKITYWQNGKDISYLDRQQYVHFDTEEEMLKIIEEKFSDRGFYFIFNENSQTSKYYNFKKASKSFVRGTGKGNQREFILECSDNGYEVKKYVSVDKDGMFCLTDNMANAFKFNRYKSNGVSISEMVYYLFKEIRSIHYIYMEDLYKVA